MNRPPTAATLGWLLVAGTLGGCPGGSDGAGGGPAEAPARPPAEPDVAVEHTDDRPPSPPPSEAPSDSPSPSAGDRAAADGETDPDPPGSEPAGDEDCDALERALRSAVARGQRCRDHDECIVVAIDAAVSPCTSSVHRDAPLADLREQAARYRTTCDPPIPRVRCAHHPGALCRRGRCTPATQEQLDRAGVSGTDTPR